MNKQIERQTITMDSINVRIDRKRKKERKKERKRRMDKEHLSKQNMHKFKEKYQSIKMYPCLSHINYL